MKSVIMGQYIPGDSWTYKLDPRTKVIALILLMVPLIAVSNLYFFGGVLLMQIIIILSSKLPIKRIINGLKPIMFLLLLTVIFQVSFNKTGDIIHQKELIISMYGLFLMIGTFTLWIFLPKITKRRFLLWLVVQCFTRQKI